jgi:hypothetical protein
MLACVCESKQMMGGSSSSVFQLMVFTRSDNH